jgi:hypothetical protein
LDYFNPVFIENYSSDRNSNSNDNNGDLEDKRYETVQNTVRFESTARMSNGINEFLKSGLKSEKQDAKNRSRASNSFNTKNDQLKQRTEQKPNLASKFDKSNIVSIKNQNKLPPSMRWVSTDDDPSPDFFADGIDTNYQRNPKALAMLVPIGSKKHHAMHSLSTEPAEHMTSFNELNFKKLVKLKPLRD